MINWPALLAVIATPALGAAGLWAVLLFLRARFPRPIGPQGDDKALPPPLEAPLVRALAPHLARHPGLTAVHAMIDPPDAFHARLGLVAAAQSSVDIEYYIWKDDTAGHILFHALRAAARRGVRARLLLDDNGTAGLDESLALFDAVPNIEVRLFNPFPIRRARVLGYLTDFARLNRRMHNKAMIFDASIAILGGRNIGDDYFSDLADDLFMDMDVTVAGPVVPKLCDQFDLFWNAASAVPVRGLLPIPGRARVKALRAKATGLRNNPGAAIYHSPPGGRDFADRLLQGDPPFIWAKAALLFDPPEKIEGRSRDHELLWRFLRAALGKPKQELVLITPYMVPGRAGVRAIRRFASDGVTVRILTNSFAATDVGIVHAGYAHRRRPLLRAGVELYEYAPDAETGRAHTALLGKHIRGTSPFSRNKLHAKVFAVDRRRVFIGSFNFDPRSLRLNTELGIVIDSSVLASGISDTFHDFIAPRAWRLSLTRAQRLHWNRPGEPPLTREPQTSLPQRAFVALASWLPIEWML